MAVGSTVVPNTNYKEGQKKVNKRKERSTKKSSQTKEFKKTTQDHEKLEMGDNDSNFEHRKYRCGVCKFVCYNRNDFQVRFTCLIKIFQIYLWYYCAFYKSNIIHVSEPYCNS